MQTNITAMSGSLTTFTDVVDFANNQVYYSYASDYQTFVTPLTDNKIIFFLTTLEIISTTLVPIQLSLSYSILDTSSYSMTLTAGFNLTIERITFSQIIYDSAVYSATVSPILRGMEWSITNALASTNIIDVQQSIVDSQFIMGLKTFDTSSGQAALDFRGQFGTYSGRYGLQVLPSVPTNVSNIGLTSSVVSVLYLMTFSCPIGYPFFNFTSEECQDACAANYYFNSTDNLCYPCTNSLCYTCDPNAPSTCLSCYTNYAIANTTCVCDTSQSSKFLVDNTTCVLCSDKLA
jgi:hypothetical protein